MTCLGGTGGSCTGRAQVRDLWAFHLGPLLLRSQYRCGGNGPGTPEASLGPGQPGQSSKATGPPNPRPPPPPNCPELPLPFLALEASPAKFSCADHGGHLEPGHCEPRAPETQREDSSRAQKAKALTKTKEPLAQECKRQPRRRPSESPGFQPRLFGKAGRHTCLPAEDRRAEERTFWGPWQGNRAGYSSADLGGSGTSSVPRPRASEPHLGEEKEWPRLSRSQPHARPSLLRPAGRTQKQEVCRCCLKLEAAVLAEKPPPCGPPCPPGRLHECLGPE